MNCPICDKKMNEYIFDRISEELHQCRHCMFTQIITQQYLSVSVKSRHMFVYLRYPKKLKEQIKKVNKHINHKRKLEHKNSIIYDPFQQYFEKFIVQYKDGEIIRIWKNAKIIKQELKLRKHDDIENLTDAIINNTEYNNYYWKII